MPAVPTVDPSCLTTIPDPDPTIPVNPEPSPIYVFAVTDPVNVPAVPVNPFGKLTAPFAPAFVIVPARIRPPVAPLTGLGKLDVFIPKTSGIKVSPSATIKSALSLTTRS